MKAKLLGNKKIMAAGLVIVLGAAFWIVGRPMVFGGSDAKATPTAAAAQASPAATAAANPGPMYRLKERVLNLNGAPRHYLKLELALEFKPKTQSFYKLSGEARKKADQEFSADLDPKVPAIEDTVTTVVAAKSIEQVSTPAGQSELKRELMERIQGVLGEPELAAVYFTQFVTQ